MVLIFEVLQPREARTDGIEEVVLKKPTRSILTKGVKLGEKMAVDRKRIEM